MAQTRPVKVKIEIDPKTIEALNQLAEVFERIRETASALSVVQVPKIQLTDPYADDWEGDGPDAMSHAELAQRGPEEA